MKKIFPEKNIFSTKLREVNSVKGRNKLLYDIIQIRSSHQRCSVRIGVLRNFTKSTGKHLCQSLLFNKVAGLRPATLLKKKLCNRCFPANFVKFLRTHFYIEHLWWLLLTNHMCLNVNNSIRTKWWFKTNWKGFHQIFVDLHYLEV